jgi:hypothetical protein
MGKVYQLVRGVVKGTLHRKKRDTTVSSPTNNDKSSLNNSIEELEKIFADGIGRLKAAVSDDQAVVSTEALHAGETIESFKANIAVLEAKLKETEDTLHKKEVASRKMEESLRIEIRELQTIVKNNKDLMLEAVNRSELAIQQARNEAASQSQQAAQVIDALKVKIATLEAQLAKTEQIAGGVEATIKSPDHDRHRRVIDLTPELQTATNGTKDIQEQDKATAIEGEQLKPGEEKPTASNIQAERVKSSETEATRETVSQETFDRLTAHFSEINNVIERVAALVLRYHVRTLGESMNEFPQARFTEHVEFLSKQISDDKRKADFRERFGTRRIKSASSI